MKKYLLSLFAVVLAVGLSSFSPKSDLKWFEYDGDINGNGTANPLNYSLVSSPSCGTTAANICEIHAQAQPNVTPERPDLDTEVFIDRTKKP